MTTPDGDLPQVEALRYLWTSELDPLFWRPARTGVPSAWYGHIPFAHWIVAAVRPRTLVELGTHYGVSYSAFCESVVRNGLDTRCYAVDTWRGDAQAGYYGEDVYWGFQRFHDGRYRAFSELLRCTFDEALPYLPDGLVDLLHIDGLHTYEAVKHDFESWRSKLSDRAIVLFHDTNVRERDFGVWRLWEELCTRFPSFEFLHGYGLGLLAVGRVVSSQVAALCSLRDPVQVHAVRERFSLLGERWDPAQGNRAQERELAARDARILALETEAARLKALEEQLAARDAQIASLQTEATRRAATEMQLRARAAQRTAQARAEAANAFVQAARPEARANAVRGARPGLRLVYLSGEPDTPGHTYRVAHYVAAAAAAGAETSWMRLDEVPTRLGELSEVDLLVIWRAPWNEQMAAAVNAARGAGARVAFDVDDLMIDPDLARLDVIDGIRTQDLTEMQVRDHYARVHSTMLAADYCTAPTEELATSMRRFNRPALVLPNGFDRTTYQTSRRAVRRRRAERPDGLVRIGFAGGSRTHQRDFLVAAEAIARVLRDRPQCRLVLFRSPDGKRPMLDIEEFPALQKLKGRIEWRSCVTLPNLPEELARFDINLAPLDQGNVYCESKSELKFFEAALVDVPTVASPTGPYRRAIQNETTGFLAEHSGDWYAHLLRLVDDPGLRHRVGRAAHHDVLWRYGSLRRVDLMLSALPQMRAENPSATRAFALELHRRQASKMPPIRILNAETVFAADQLRNAEVTVAIPLHNYAHYVEEALESVRRQSLELLDLVVVDDASTDDSLSVAVSWAQRHAGRFNRIIVLRNPVNAGLGPTRNVAIDAAETPFVLPLDADNLLLPRCCEVCLSAARASSAAFAYPSIQKFGEESGLLGGVPFDPARFIGGNYVDAMALVSKEAWAAAGGFGEFQIMGWEDFDFWCRLVEKGLFGCPAGDGPLAEYRVHGTSMIWSTTLTPRNAPAIIADLERRHPWLNIVFPSHTNTEDAATASAQPVSRLERLLPILRCPETKKPLEVGPDGNLRTTDGSRSWRLVAGRPNLFPHLDAPQVLPESHLSNPLPENAISLIEEARGGLVLNLSAGGTAKRFENVVEAEAAVFRHTDLVADAHNLPFVDGAFEAVIAMNAFEHYRDPKRAANELFRVLRPGGRVLIRTAFLQPLHEKPWHFYNCTRYGLEEWFKEFETLQLHVSDNFSPGYSISWLASECEAALRRDASPAAADQFKGASMERIISFWRGGQQARATDEVWSALAQLPQAAQESIAAGFEYFGRRPLR
ncbi:MAG: class I SAM-dependent methyltransferase [Verrucomicrobia bacterium]|nr:class I SAM-dependent methyltransferase [Verrucomicrobiota bacterium]